MVLGRFHYYIIAISSDGVAQATTEQRPNSPKSPNAVLRDGAIAKSTERVGGHLAVAVSYICNCGWAVAEALSPATNAETLRARHHHQTTAANRPVTDKTIDDCPGLPSAPRAIPAHARPPVRRSAKRPILCRRLAPAAHCLTIQGLFRCPATLARLHSSPIRARDPWRCCASAGLFFVPGSAREVAFNMAFLILVIGDLHIPDRAIDIPAKVGLLFF